MTSRYVELQATSHFSFLRGVSSCEELYSQAAVLGLPAMAVVDRNSVAGLVRAWEASKVTGVRHIPACRLDLADGTSLLVYPRDLAAWTRLCRLLTVGKARGGKGACELHWDDVRQWSEGMTAILLPDMPDGTNAAALAELKDVFGRHAYMALTLRRRPDDAMRIHELNAQSLAHGVRPVVTGDVLYHHPERRMLQDVVTAIREKTTVDDLGFRRERFVDRHLKSGAEMERLFRAYPDAIVATADIAAACTFELGQIRYRYPDELGPPGSSQVYLEQLTHAAVERMFPGGVPAPYTEQIAKELTLIGELGYAPYFLTVNNIVAEARRRGILCQGRGSAANSCVCFVLGITSIDPIQNELLFERFVSGERKEPPDIDVDFEHDRREEIIQWIYETYGRERSALTAVVNRFRARGSVREVGKALGLPVDMTASLAGLVWGWSEEGVGEREVEQLNLDLTNERLRTTLDLARQLIGTPRHLSQHPGGFVLANGRLDEVVPVEPAAMADRQVIEWDKDDIDALGMMKVDVLGLGMLGCMRRVFELLAEHRGIAMDMASPTLQVDDPATFAMIQKADTLGVFQIESRAQMSMLPRMKPTRFYDLVIEVAIVRPGPIQGDMVHPYLRRREGKEKPEYPRPELQAVLEKTLGVPLFQEQAMKVAIVGAGFTPVEADQLRRAMSTFKLTGGVSHFFDKLVGGMIERGYPRDFAERTFKQIEGFGSYGFPESHAASFAKIAYASSWAKCHHPDVFCTALLNAQPMGFYAPAQIVRDARNHGVKVLPVDINKSRWDCTLEDVGERYFAVRLGFRMVRRLSNPHAAMIVGARQEGPFASIEDVWQRSGAPATAIELLADADAFLCLDRDRRRALWSVRGLGAAPLPLFAAADAREGFAPETPEAMVTLKPLTEGKEVVEDYRTVQLSLRAHPLTFVREALRARGVKTCAELDQVKEGRLVEVAGIILVRQKPGSAKGVLFITIEDETGVAQGILWPDRFEAQRRVVLSASMIGLRGRLQREGIVTHIIIDWIIDYTPMLRSIGDMTFPHRPGPGDGATHGGGPDPRGPSWPRPHEGYYPPFRDGANPETIVRQKSRNFH